MWECEIGVCSLYVLKLASNKGKEMSCALYVIQGTYFSDNYCVSLPGAAAPYVWEMGQVVYVNVVNEPTGSGNR